MYVLNYAHASRSSILGEATIVAINYFHKSDVPW